MSGQHFLETAVIFLLATVIAVPITKRFRLGAVLGYLLAGVVIGPAELHLVPDPGRAAITIFAALSCIGRNLFACAGAAKRAWVLAPRNVPRRLLDGRLNRPISGSSLAAGLLPQPERNEK